MQTSGYSKRSLNEKLGIKPGYKVALLHAPKGYEMYLDDLPSDVTLSRSLSESLNLIQYFTTKTAELEKDFPTLANAIKPDGMIWISWPKGSAKVETDLNENSIRNIGLAHGVVDVKVIAVDETWSGLKFVVRLKDRA